MNPAENNGAWPRTVRVLLLLALAGCILFIFSNSLQKGGASEARSGLALTRAQAVLTAAGLPQLAAFLTDHIIRKLGHFSEYLLEGVLLLLCLRAQTARFGPLLSRPLLAGLLTALCDESIQLFTAGRSGQVSDVWIDFAGVCGGILAARLVLAVCRGVRKRRRKRA